MLKFYILYSPGKAWTPINYRTLPEAEAAARVLSDTHDGLAVYLCEVFAYVAERRQALTYSLETPELEENSK